MQGGKKMSTEDVLMFIIIVLIIIIVVYWLYKSMNKPIVNERVVRRVYS